MNTLYTVTVAVGNDIGEFDNFTSVLSIYLLVNDLPVASSAITSAVSLPNGTIANLSTSSLGTVSRLPLDIAIRYAGTSRLVSRDNVRLYATVASSPVPEPATMLLLGSGLVGLAGFRKKFKK